MISGDLIRLKNSVDDCTRSARSIRREAGRLTPEEITQLAEYVKEQAPYLTEVLDLSSIASETTRRS